MVKMLDHPKITVQTAAERYEFDATDASIGSMTGGATHFLATGELHNMQKTSLKPLAAQFYVAFDAPETGPTSEQTAGLKAVAAAAKAIERRRLVNARDIERAITAAQTAMDIAEHEFNMAVLEALHTGLSNEDIEKHLDSVKLFGFEGHVETVGRFDVEDLYTLDTTN